MPDISSLLHESIAEDLEDLLVPEGYWNGFIRGGKLYETDSEGEQLTYKKSGDPYARLVLYIQCDEPVTGVDQEQADAYLGANGPQETSARFTAFVNGRRDIKALTNKLAACGALTNGRTFADILEELKDARVPCTTLVEHREFNGTPEANAIEISPQES